MNTIQMSTIQIRVKMRGFDSDTLRNMIQGVHECRDMGAAVNTLWIRTLAVARVVLRQRAAA